MHKLYFVHVADGLAYSALLKNELLGAGIEKIQDPQTEDRRLQPSTPEKRSLFTVWQFHPTLFLYWLIKHIDNTMSAQIITICSGPEQSVYSFSSVVYVFLMKTVENMMVAACVFFAVFTQYQKVVTRQWHQHLPLLSITCQQQKVEARFFNII